MTVRILPPLPPLPPIPTFWVLLDEVGGRAVGGEPAPTGGDGQPTAPASPDVSGPSAPQNPIEAYEADDEPNPATVAWSEQSIHHDVMLVGLMLAEDTEEAEWLLRVQAGIADVEHQAKKLPQSIPHNVMLAGLLAASKIRAPGIFDNPGTRPEQSGDLWADGAASLRDTPPLAGFTLRQWTTIANDAVALVATWGDELRRLGWSDVDVFGIDPDVLGRAVRGWGLALLIDGGRVVEVTETVATIERPSGARLSFKRRPMVGAVPIWTVGQSADRDPLATWRHDDNAAVCAGMARDAVSVPYVPDASRAALLPDLQSDIRRILPEPGD